MRFFSSWTIGFIAAIAASALAQTPAPKATYAAPVKNVADEYFGTRVDDPYRYFENLKDPIALGWMKSQSEHATETLARIGGRDSMLKALKKYAGSTPAAVGGVTRTLDGAVFFEKRNAKDTQFKLYRRHGLDGAERLLVDPEALQRSTGQPHAINYYSASPDGRYVAYGVSKGGSEAAVLRVLDVKSGRPIGEAVDRADLADPGWTPDSKTLVFTRLRKLPRGTPASEKYLKPSVFAWKIGTPIASARTVFGPQSEGVDLLPADAGAVRVTPEGDAIAMMFNGVDRNMSAYVCDAESFASASPKWRKLFGTDAKIERFVVRNGQAFAITSQGAPRYQLIAGALDGFPKNARVAVAAGERVLTGVAAAKDAIYLEARDGNVKRLLKLQDGAGEPIDIALPVASNFALNGFESVDTVADVRVPGLVITLTGWTRAPQIYAVDANGAVVNTGLRPSGAFDAPVDIEATEVFVPTADGAKVPMSILHKKNVAFDGSHPTLLNGYASYGITNEPRFTPSVLAWIDAGGIYAVANPRGSSVYGAQWYLDGKGLNKPNTWKDFIACAEWLVANKVTSPSKLAISGGSAGGILVGRAMTQRPDLFAAVVISVGATDTVRAETTANGATNIPEFGTVKTEEGCKALLEMSTYAHITPGTRYPAVLLVHGFNDPRVDVWESAKTAARLQAATTSDKPVLLRIDFAAGHGVGSTQAQQLSIGADVYSFLLWQMGEPGFALKP